MKHKQPGLVKAEPYTNKTSNSRNIKSAPRGGSEKSKSGINQNSSNADNSNKRSASYKDHKQKPSPLRTQKVSNKTGVSLGSYMPGGKTKANNSANMKKFKALNTATVKTTPPHPNSTTYKEPIHQHANLLKQHNLSLNNFKTEIRLPNAQKFMNETQFAKSPFLSKTLKGMMQSVKPQQKHGNSHASNYGRIGNSFQANASRRREPSGHSRKSKRDASNSHKKGSKAHQQQQKMFTSKKLSFNQSGPKPRMVNADHMNLLSRKLNSNKIYSRNDTNTTMGPG